LRRIGSGILDSLYENRSRFIVRILTNVAAEGFGENRLGEPIDVRLGFRVERFNLVRQRKQRFNASFLAISTEILVEF